MSPRGSLLLNPLPRQFLGAYALEDAPALVQRGGGVYDVVDLVSARERPPSRKMKRLGSRCKSWPAVSIMRCRQKSSCQEEYSISSAEKSACRTSSLFSTRPPRRLASSRASVV